MKNLLLVIILSVLSIGITQAEGTATMSLSNVSLNPGGEAVLQVNLSNPDDNVTGVQCDLYLPDGLGIKKGENGEVISQITDRTNPRSPHVLSWAVQKDGAIRLLNYSTTNQVYKGTNGAVIEMTLVADKNVNFGDYKISLKNIVLSHPNGSVIKPANYTATASVTSPEYYITYMLDSIEFYKQKLVVGSTISPKDAPFKTGYTFSGWKGLPQTMPAHDVTVTGYYIANKYQVSFVADGKIVSGQTLDYGTEVTLPVAPEKEGHSFVGWGDVDKTVPAHDVTYTAEYEVNSYRLTYILNGEFFAEDSVAYNSIITPLKVEGYDIDEFSGWEGLPKIMPAHDVIVYGNGIIDGINSIKDETKFVMVLSLNGTIVKRNVEKSRWHEMLPPGLYIVGGKKILLK